MEQGQDLFKAVLEKHFSPALAAQMLSFNHLFQELLTQIPEKSFPLLDLEAGYWQELFLLWQRFMVKSGVEADAEFLKEYRRIHLGYFQRLLKVSDQLNTEKLQSVLKELTVTAVTIA